MIQSKVYFLKFVKQNGISIGMWISFFFFILLITGLVFIDLPLIAAFGMTIFFFCIAIIPQNLYSYYMYNKPWRLIENNTIIEEPFILKDVPVCLKNYTIFQKQFDFDKADVFIFNNSLIVSGINSSYLKKNYMNPFELFIERSSSYFDRYQILELKIISKDRVHILLQHNDPKNPLKIEFINSEKIVEWTNNHLSNFSV